MEAARKMLPSFTMPSKLLPILALLTITLCACSPKKSIEGCWKATDSTIFHFRHDGTFIGRDYVGRPIWGNWVELGQGKFGFQSLFHMGSYEPQYAVVTSPDAMKYVGTVGVVFIKSTRISEQEAAPEIEKVIASIPTENKPIKE